MNRRGFFARALGAVAAVVVYPLDKAFEAALKPSEEFIASIGEWSDRYSYSDPEIAKSLGICYDKEFMQTLKHEIDSLATITSRRSIPVNAGVKREFFRYES